MFEKRIRLGNLFDFYGSLLTEKQQEILRLYCVHDFSLGEISENLGISRQAVYDTIKRSRKTLNDYEEKLKLLAKFSNTRTSVNELINQIEGLTNIINSDYEKSDILSEIANMKRALLDILDESL
ncbi:YlxM family DNA-binding protein [Wukongibacter sp. M2B1]|uniref:YlxM family DNA-binding protein n=1 Tax=Wukongibacter sp. M2B1 TaxID=3088895 RepID=UPI003D7A95BD